VGVTGFRGSNCGRHRFGRFVIVGVTGFRGLFALEWAWHIRVTPLSGRGKLFFILK